MDQKINELTTIEAVKNWLNNRVYGNLELIIPGVVNGLIRLT